MNARAQFDVGPLSWVKAEIDMAMRSGAEALREFAAAGGVDTNKFDAGVAYLHQADGALAIVGLDGVTRVAQELEGLLADIGKGAVNRDEGVFELVNRAIFAITGYLEQLMSGAPNQPLRLFPIYRELATVRAAGGNRTDDSAGGQGASPGAGVDPADLYYPDLSPRPPRRERTPVTLHTEEAQKYFRDQRTRFQRGFLKWLKEDASGAPEMFEAVRAIELTQGLTSQRSFWWAAQAFFEALVQGALPPELDARRICNRVEAQLRRLVEGSQNVAERLMREVLYGVALAKPASPGIAEVQQTFRLAGTVPDSAAAPMAEPEVLGRVREQLALVKDCWNRLANSGGGAEPEDMPTIGAFTAMAQHLASATTGLGNSDLARLAEDIAAVGTWLAGDSGRMSEAVALEVATALLLLENVVERLSGGKAVSGEDFRAQREFVSSRLKAVREGNLLRTAPGIPLLDEMSQRAQERLITNQVVTEMQSNLRLIEQVLDSFFRDPSRHGELATLAKPLQQLLGALDMLGELRARDALAMCAAGIIRYAEPGYKPLPGDFEATAQALSGLGFYFEALLGGKADFDAAMRPVQAAAVGIATAPEPRARFATTAPDAAAVAVVATVEAQLEQQKEKAQELLQKWKRRPTDTMLKAELQRELSAIQQDAGLVADTGLESRTQDALQALEGEPSEPSAQDAVERVVEQALGGLALDAPAPSAQAARLIDASSEAVDAELLDIYLEEAVEVLVQIAMTLATLRANPADSEALNTARRSFHTLKGSGRMVGLMRLGDAAWAVEQTLNRWLQHGLAATPELLALFEAGQRYFAGNVAGLRRGEGSSDESALVAMAEALRGVNPSPQSTTPVEEHSASHLETAAPTIAAPVALESQDASGNESGVDFAAMSNSLAESMSADRAVSQAEPVVRAASDASETRANETPDEAAGEDTIELAGHRVSTTVFTLFSGEAHAHLGALRAEHETLVNHGVVTDEMMRAAHTLAGLAGTVQLDALRELGYAFEHALSQLSTDTLSEDELALISEALEAVDRMVSAAVEMRAPRPEPELIVRLTNAAAPRMVADLNPDDMLLPEEEAALPRSVEEAALPRSVEEAALPRSVEDAALPRSVADDGEMTAVASTEVPLPVAQDADEEEQFPAAGETPVERKHARVPDEIDSRMLPIFLEEADDLMPAIDAALRAWRETAENQSTETQGFDARGRTLQRLLHTFKGSARMAGAMALGEITHHMESRVDAALLARTAAGALFDDLDASWDRVGALNEQLRQEELRLSAQDGAAADGLSGAAGGAAGTEDVAQAVVVRDGDTLQSMLRVRSEMVDRLVSQAGEVAIARSRIENEVRALKASIGELTDNVSRLRSQLREIEIQAETRMQAASGNSAATNGAGSMLYGANAAVDGANAAVEGANAMHKEGFDPLEFDRFTRFQELTRIMAESVNDVQTVQQNLLQGITGVDTALATQARLSRDLQHDLLHVRMVPLGSLAERLHRIVRVTARELGKRVSLDIHGARVELDRAVLERITPALEHLLRNAVMHGIEPPAQRAAAGKPASGEIHLELTQQGNEIRLVLSDDGAGLDLDRIRSRARDKGLLADAATVSDAELADFIFVPGFTTAGQVTQIAGRGIGMDVVRTVVAGLGGRVEIVSTRGAGMQTLIFLPLTLAVTQSVLAHAGARLFAIPSVMVEHVLQYRPEELQAVQQAGQVDWQGRRYPLQHLSQLVGEHEHGATARHEQPVDARRATIAVLLLKSGASSMALQVQELAGGNQEIVVKATGPHLQHVAGVTGATVLGSGEIVLIVNPVQLARHAAEHAARLAAGTTGQVPEPAAASVEEAAPPLVMVVDDSLTVRKITGRLLERQGYDVVVAKDGVDALEKLADIVPAVMLVDIEMPRMDGFELTRRVRADARLAAVPIIVISSRSADKHRNFALEIGVNAFLGKPYREEELLSQIRGFVKPGG